MTHLISIIRSFLSELFFKNKEEAEFGHPKFNIFKWIKFSLVLFSFVLNIFAIPKLTNLAVEHRDLILKHEKLELKLKETEGRLVEEQYKNFTP